MVQEECCERVDLRNIDMAIQLDSLLFKGAMDKRLHSYFYFQDIRKTLIEGKQASFDFIRCKEKE